MGLEKSTLKVEPFILLSSVVNKSQLCAAVLYELLAKPQDSFSTAL